MSAPPDTIEYDTARVLAFLASRGNHVAHSDRMAAIGVCRSGQLIAGAVFEAFNGVNVWVHIAVRDAHAMSRRFIALCVGYAFLTCGVRRVSAMVAASNTLSVRAARKFGFQQEAVLSGAAEDGGDMLVMVLRRQECRYV